MSSDKLLLNLAMHENSRFFRRGGEHAHRYIGDAEHARRQRFQGKAADALLYPRSQALTNGSDHRQMKHIEEARYRKCPLGVHLRKNAKLHRRHWMTVPDFYQT
jgi:hypothetical protein